MTLLLVTLRRIRLCQSDVTAQLLFETFVAQEVAEARASTRAGIIAALGAVMTCPCCLKQMDCADDCTFSVDRPSEAQYLTGLRDAVRTPETMNADYVRGLP